MAPIPGMKTLSFVLRKIRIDDVADVVLVFDFGEERVVGFVLVLVFLDFDVGDGIFVIGVDNRHTGGFRFGLFLDDFIVVVGHHHRRLILDGLDDLLGFLGLLRLLGVLFVVCIGVHRHGSDGLRLAR